MSAKYQAFFLSLLALLCWCAGYLTVAYTYHHQGWVADEFATDIWMLCDAFGKSLIILACMALSSELLRQWLTFIFFLSINNILDEVWFNPYSLGWNEAAITVVLAIYYTTQITKAIYAKQ